MERHLALNDTDFQQQFEMKTLDPKLFSHEAHLRLAWIYIGKYGVDKAIEKLCITIKMYAESQGAFNKFNKTLTIAAVKAVNHFLQKSKSTSFKNFIVEFPRLKYSFKDLISTHYGFDIFSSDEAKTNYLAPDLHPFD